jgi:hypothetical protein
MSPTETAALPSGPLPLSLPQAPSLHLKARRLGERLRGHTTSDLWLLEGLSPELDAAREEHLERRSRLAAVIREMRDLAARFSRENAEHEAKLLDAAREGKEEPADTRTSPERRGALRIACDERYIAAMEALAETAEKVVALLKRQEPQLLIQQKQALRAAEEKRRELEAQMQAARGDVWRAEMLARWVKNQVDDGPFGRQPVQAQIVPPAQWQPRAESFERHWTDAEKDRREIDAMAAERVREIQEAGVHGDPTGVVFDLEPDAA